MRGKHISYKGYVIAIMVVLFMAATCFVAFPGVAPTDERPAEAATATAFQTVHSYASCAVKYDDTYFQSASVSGGSYSGSSLYWTPSFTLIPKAQYSWSSSFTSISVQVVFCDDTSSPYNAAGAMELKNAVTEKGPYTFTRSGNTFTYDTKIGSYSFSSTCYCVYYVDTTSAISASNLVTKTVSFNSNGGSSCSTKYYYPDATCTYGTLPTSTKSGFTFYGWYTTPDFITAKLTNSSTFTSSHTVYARWGVTLSLNLQGGSGVTSINTPYNAPMDTIAKPTLSGYTFAGYFTDTLGKGVQYYGSDMQSTHVCDLAQGTTLYACWQSVLNLDLEGGTGDTSVIAIYNDNMPEILKPVRSGYTFGGYFTAKNGSGTRYYTNSMGSAHLNDLPNGTTLFAYWMINTYVLYYNPNGGTVSSTQTSITFGATVTPPTPTRTGYTFFGWYMDDERYSGGIWTFTENKTVTAKWGYTLTYNPDGGYVTPGSVSIIDGDMVVTPTPTRPGCLFGGWQIGNVDYYGGVWAFNSNQTAKAKWLCEFYVSMNDGAGGSISGTESDYYTLGSSISVTATAISGYVFDYWLINDKKVTTATYTGTLNRNTEAVAYFKKTFGTANVTATNGTIASTLLSVDEENFGATLRITPEVGKYIDEISFDNVAYYKIDSWATKLYASSSFAQNVAYQANEGNNNLWLTFNYYDTSKPVNVYVKLTTTKYTNLTVPKNQSGALDGIAVCANYGGSVTLIGADYETLADSDTIICSAKLAQSGYEFVGWCFADLQSNILSTEESARFEKSQIYGRQLMAKFQPTADNPNYNLTLNNE